MSKTKLEKKTLREWRDDRGLTQAGVARMAGVNSMTIHHLENGHKSPNAPSLSRVCDVLDITPDQISAVSVREDLDPSAWPDDGLIPEAPKQPMRWWRERRGITQMELASLARVGLNTVKDIEQGQWGSARAGTKRKLAKALKVRTHNIIFPGDNTIPSSQRSVENVLRSELRGARRALRKAHDFIREDPNIAFKSLDKRDAILPDIERELRGL